MARNTDLSPGSTEVELLGRTYEISFTLDAVDEICDAFKCKVRDISKMIQDNENPDFRKNMVKMLAILINSSIKLHNEDYPQDTWQEITETQIRRRLTHLAYARAFEALVNAYVCGFISDGNKQDDDDIGADPNQMRAT